MPGASRSKWPALATLRTPQAKPSYCRRGAVASMVESFCYGPRRSREASRLARADDPPMKRALKGMK